MHRTGREVPHSPIGLVEREQCYARMYTIAISSCKYACVSFYEHIENTLSSRSEVSPLIKGKEKE